MQAGQGGMGGCGAVVTDRGERKKGMMRSGLRGLKVLVYWRYKKKVGMGGLYFWGPFWGLKAKFFCYFLHINMKL